MPQDGKRLDALIIASAQRPFLRGEKWLVAVADGAASGQVSPEHLDDRDSVVSIPMPPRHPRIRAAGVSGGTAMMPFPDLLGLVLVSNPSHIREMRKEEPTGSNTDESCHDPANRRETIARQQLQRRP
eukprot:CAMPEP_0172456962 /NCGR_PEP_ID=MMETSP1065-20121228/18687_1 /TAXON_ID=265537 /ORGANISM="Amphiprora paludosa, Strain CCMP125" /LENGTH=127 /DNA_ID=CAMNT_0013210319 /DNA_START=51 /DNA_END=432 /DNA_ORIENTATION=-